MVTAADGEAGATARWLDCALEAQASKLSNLYKAQLYKPSCRSLICTNISSTVSGYAATFYMPHLHKLVIQNLEGNRPGPTWISTRPAAPNCQLYCRPYMQTDLDQDRSHIADHDTDLSGSLPTPIG